MEHTVSTTDLLVALVGVILVLGRVLDYFISKKNGNGLGKTVAIFDHDDRNSLRTAEHNTKETLSIARKHLEVSTRLLDRMDAHFSDFKCLAREVKEDRK
jgi:hypothetical protein